MCMCGTFSFFLSVMDVWLASLLAVVNHAGDHKCFNLFEALLLNLLYVFLEIG